MIERSGFYMNLRNEWIYRRWN